MPSEDTQFKTGNPGRPKGSRNKLSEAFLQALADDFKEFGAEAIQATRISKPESYLGTIGRLMPKLMELSGIDGSDIPTSIRIDYSGIPAKAPDDSGDTK